MAGVGSAGGMDNDFGDYADALVRPDANYSMGFAATRPAGYDTAGRRAQQVMQYVGSRTFYRDGDKWVDSRYKAEQETTKVKAFSKEYFDLVAANEDLGKCFALGSKVIVVVADKAYETTE